MTAEALIVEAEGQTCGGEGSETLVGRDAAHAVVVDVERRLRRAVGGMAVVDVVVTPAVEGTHSTREPAIVVGERDRGHAPRDVHVVVDERSRDRTGIGRLLVGDVHVAVQLPVAIEAVAELEKAARLTEGCVGAMAVGALIVQPCD